MKIKARDAVSTGAVTAILWWNSLKEERREAIKKQLRDIRTRLDEVRKENLPRLPDTFLTDLICQVNWHQSSTKAFLPVAVVSSSDLTGFLQSDAAKAIADKAFSAIDSITHCLEEGGRDNVIIAVCLMMTVHQLSMCMELKSLLDAKTPEGVAGFLGIDLVKIQKDVLHLTEWWKDVRQYFHPNPNRQRKKPLNFHHVEDFIVKSEMVSLHIMAAQEKLVAYRKTCEVSQKTAEATQSVTGLLSVAFLGSWFSSGKAAMMNRLGMGTAIVGCVASTWYLQKLDLGIDRLKSLNIRLQEFSVQLARPMKVIEESIEIIESDMETQTMAGSAGGIV